MNSPRQCQEKVFAAIELGRWELALKMAAEDLSEFPDCVKLHAAAAYAACELNRLDEALAAASRVVELEPEGDDGFRLLMDVYRRYGNAAVDERQGRLAWQFFDQARVAGEEAVRLNPFCVWTIASLSQIHEVLGNRDQAGALATQALETNPDDLAAPQVYGRAHAKDGDPEAAEGAVRRGLELSPENAFFHRMLAELLLARNEFRGAYDECRTALQLAPCDREAQDLFGRVLQTQSPLIRGVLRLHTFFIARVLRRAIALAAFMGGMLLLAAAAETFLPANLKGSWTILFFLGFLALLTLVAEPERIANFIWFFARHGKAAGAFKAHTPP